MTVNLNQIPSLIISWLKWFGQIALVAVVALLLAKALGFPVPLLVSMNWQESGVFVAGMAYALR